MKASKTRRFLIPTILCGMALVGIVYYYFFASFSKTDETQYVYIDDDDNADDDYMNKPYDGDDINFLDDDE